MDIATDISNGISRWYERFGGNEGAIELDGPAARFNDAKLKISPIGLVVGFPIAALGALIFVSLEWIFDMPVVAWRTTYSINKVSPAVNVEAPRLVPLTPFRATPVTAADKLADAKEVALDPLPVTPTQPKAAVIGSRPVHYFFGAPGLAIGALLAVAGALVIGLVRSLWQSPKSFGYTLEFLVTNAWGYDSVWEDDRHWSVKWLMGAPGVLVGALVFAPVPVVLGLAYRLVLQAKTFLSNSRTTFEVTFKRVFKIFATDGMYDAIFDPVVDERPFLDKLAGSLGLLAAIPAVLMSLPIIMVRTVTNNGKAFWHTCKYLLNFALQRNYIPNVGWNNYKEHRVTLGYGWPGALAALATVGIVSLTVKGLRTVLPGLLGAVFGVLWFGWVRIVDEASKFRGGQLLDKKNQGAMSDAIHEKILDVFANKDPITGRPDTDLPKKHDGNTNYSEQGGSFWANFFSGKNWLKFLRKMGTGNFRTLEEDFFHDMVKNLSKDDELAIPELNQQLQALLGQKEAWAVELAAVEQKHHEQSPMFQSIRDFKFKRQVANIANAVQGLDEKIALVNRELDLRRSPDKSKITQGLLELTRDTGKQRYKHKSSLAMAATEKHYNNEVLDGLCFFMQKVLQPTDVAIAESKDAAPPPRYEDIFPDRDQFFKAVRALPSAPPEPAPAYSY